MITHVIVEDDRWQEIADIEALVKQAVASVFVNKPCSVDVLLSNDEDIRVLNRDFRKKDTPTNVLAFPASLMPVPEGETAHLGDIVLAHETVAREASEQSKPMAHHVTHLIVHASLHLLGHDHDIPEAADKMENDERVILARLGIPDPYQS
jgi:probable rRNA maturation factor